jgi:hypothetical protein
LYGFDDPREAGFRLAGFVWAMRIIFAVGADRFANVFPSSDADCSRGEKQSLPSLMKP